MPQIATRGCLYIVDINISYLSTSNLNTTGKLLIVVPIENLAIDYDYDLLNNVVSLAESTFINALILQG